MPAKKTEKTETDQLTFDKAQQAWSDTLERQAKQINSLCEEWSRVEKKSTSHTLDAINEFAKISRATIEYTFDLNEQFRGMALNAMNSWSAAK